jgi:hypothetical protein
LNNLYSNFPTTGVLGGSNSICTDFISQYNSLDQSIKNIIISDITTNNQNPYDEIAAGVKQLIGEILTNASPNPSDHAVLTNFYNHEISPGISSAKCIVINILG